MSANEKLVAQFSDWLAGQGRSASTVRTYAVELERLAAWAGPSPLTKVGARRLASYLDESVREGDAPATYNVRLAALRKFCSWLVQCGLTNTNAAADLRGQHMDRAPVSYLPREAVRTLLEVLQGNLRDSAILLLVLSTGVRLMELVGLDRPDFRVEGAGAEVEVRSPGTTVRIVYPSQQAAEAVGDYLDSRRDDSIPLFISRLGIRLAARTVQGSFAAYFRAAGVSGSLQTLRYTFAVHRAQSGLDSHQLQELMGYRTLESTRVYHTAEPSGLREAAHRTEERY